MCGLAGVAAAYINDGHRKVFTELMIGAQLRGYHSAGVGVVFKEYNKTADYTWDKTVGGPHDLFERASFDKAIKKNTAKVLMGHCRHATQGTVCRANAHPFETPHLLGMHNGTIRGKQEDEEYYGTDSECLLNRIDDHGPIDTLANTDGAWALNWFDIRDGSLNFVRNDQRTLYFGRNTKRNELFWTSEAMLLHWILARNNVKDIEYFMMKTDTLCSFNINAKDDWLADAKFSACPGRKEVSVEHGNSHFPSTGEKSSAETKQGGTETGQTSGSSEVKNPPANNVVAIHQTSGTNTSKPTEAGTSTLDVLFDDLAKSRAQATEGLTATGFNGKKISPAKLRELLSEGCVNCEHIPGRKEGFRFLSENVFLCAACKDDPGVVAMVQTRIEELKDDIDDVNAKYERIRYEQALMGAY